MTEHTPGPWRAVPDPVDGRDYEVLVVCGMGMAETWLARAEYNWKEAGPRQRRISFVEAQANARLIAAAPELLAALEGIDEELSLWGEDTLERMNLTARLEAIRAAIAKARGRA